MGNTKKDQSGESTGAGKRINATKLILAATALVVAATVYVLIADPFGGGDGKRENETIDEQARQVLRSMEGLIAAADAIDPRGGKANLAKRQVSYQQAADLGRSFVRYADQRDVLVRPVLARALLRLNRIDDAEKTVNALLKLAPRSAEGLCLKGEILASRKDPAALEHFRRAAESERATPEIIAHYGAALIPAGQYERAEATLLRALRAGCRKHNVLLGLAALAMRDNRHGDAEVYLTELANRPGPSIQTRMMLAQCQKENAKPAEAEKTIRKLLATDDVPERHIPLGDVLDIQGKLAEAAAEYAYASDNALSPEGEAVASFKAGRAYYALEKYALAMKYIDRAAVLTDNAPRADVAELRYWRKKIEDARFGKVASSEGAGSLLLPPPDPAGSAAGDANTASPTNRPGGSLLDFRWKK